MYLNPEIMILVERILVLYMTFTSPGYCSGHQYVVYETSTNVQTYISCACATIIWQVWIDFFLHYSMHSIFTVYHDG